MGRPLWPTDRADWICFGKVIVEIKAVSALATGAKPSALAASTGLIAYWDFRRPLQLSMTLGQGTVNLIWDLAVTRFLLETTTSLMPPVQWTPVPGVVNNQIAVPMQGTNRFYRLRCP
jgi:hypothetical protein